MVISPSSTYKLYSYILAIVGLLIASPVAISEKAILGNTSGLTFLLFGILLGITHFWLIRRIWRMSLRIPIVIATYALVIDGFVYVFITRSWSPLMALPPIIVFVLLFCSQLLRFLLNYQLKRSRFQNIEIPASFPCKAREIQIEVCQLHEYDAFIVLAFSLTAILSPLFNWDLSYSMMRFVQRVDRDTGGHRSPEAALRGARNDIRHLGSL